MVIPSVYADQREGYSSSLADDGTGSSCRHINALAKPSIAHKSEREGRCGCDDVGMRDSESVSSHRRRLVSPRMFTIALRLRIATILSAISKWKRGRDAETTVKRTSE